mmetsp:Transcript_10526/g.22680  ORF Transcript_10526/g.22680 Transcript_10526/m.22680 type:complete len:165 (-) Transcript_10526:141-635(-)
MPALHLQAIPRLVRIGANGCQSRPCNTHQTATAAPGSKSWKFRQQFQMDAPSGAAGLQQHPGKTSPNAERATATSRMRHHFELVLDGVGGPQCLRGSTSLHARVADCVRVLVQSKQSSVNIGQLEFVWSFELRTVFARPGCRVAYKKSFASTFGHARKRAVPYY